MIEKNTVIVLGAGASHPFKYPIGRGLKNMILQQAHLNPNTLDNMYYRGQGAHQIRSNINLTSEGQNGLIEYLILKKEYTPKEISTFYTNFLGTSKPSIDTFLENRKEFLTIGKIFIAYAILLCENVLALSDDNAQNWYRYLMNELNTSTWDNFSKNKLSIVTYNYDRSIETFLANDLRHTNGKSIEDSINKVNETIPIKHVHGIIAEVPSGTNKEYGGVITTADIDNAIDKLHIITEEDSVKKAYEDVHLMLQKAEKVFILGFGFDDRNMERLNLVKNTKNAMVFATRTGLSDLEVKKINSKVDYKILFSKDETHDIVSFLKREVNLNGNFTDEFIAFNNQIRQNRF